MEQKYEVNITEYALAQMDAIKQYIAYELFSPQAAKKLLLAMKKTAASLRIKREFACQGESECSARL